MDDILTAFTGILVVINLFAVMIAIATISEIYNKNSISYECIAQVLCIVINVVNIRIIMTLESANYAGLALLLQVGILIVYVLMIKMILSDDYKCNVKPYQHIKIKL